MAKHEMKLASWTQLPAAAVIKSPRRLKALSKKKGDDRDWVAACAGTHVDTSKMDPKRVQAMIEKSYPALLELSVVIDDGKNTQVHGPGLGMKIEVDRSVGREHAPDTRARRK